MLLSYGDDLATEHSSAARSMFGEYAPQIMGSGMAKDSKSVSRWMVDTGDGKRSGGMTSCGIGSSVTGRRADLIVIDDPYKNWDEANSEMNRDRVWDAYRSVIRSRLRPGGCIIVIQTRWHKDDLTGRLLRHAGGMRWELCKLPARAVAGDMLGRAPGEALWPAMYDDLELHQVEGDIGPIFWACQFQQEPEEPEGRLFKASWFRYWRPDGPDLVLESDLGPVRYGRGDCVVVQTVDPNLTDEKSSDFFCQAAWALCPGGEIVLLAVQRERIETTEHVDEVGAFYDRWGAACILLSKRSSGMNLFQQLEDLGYALEEIVEDVSKLSRSVVIMRKYRRGEVYHPEGATWVGDIEGELKEFPGSKNDDFVDNASAVGIYSSQIGLGVSDTVISGGAARVGSGFGIREDNLWPERGSNF
ncbi:MAG: hypothetical protein B7Z62_00220 [Deltaproteobacteria bacterium 37-65-8]|nr:MAG: hypothetical protein B7Z62_00220 [Deltaproteobacteria bacterium 37-65-8]